MNDHMMGRHSDQKYAKYTTQCERYRPTVMYVRMATWPIASRDVAGTPVPRLFTVACPWLSPGLE